MVVSQTKLHILEVLKYVTKFSPWYFLLLSIFTVLSRQKIEAIVILEYKIRIVLVGKHVQFFVAGHLILWSFF